MIINLTPHPITIFKSEAPDVIDEPEFTGWVLTTIPKSDLPFVRIVETNLGDYVLSDGSRVAYIEYGHLSYNPPRVFSTFYIVSLATALAARDRSDFLVPYREVRNLNGTVIGCRSLAKPC